MQSKKHSFIESLTNVVVGYAINMPIQLVIFYFFEVDIPLSDNFLIGLCFTLVSVARSYLIRRYFNALPKSRRQEKTEPEQRS